jgi:uncharacterized damage-inducible protein DinB
LNPFFSDYLKSLEELHNDIRSAIKNLPPEALDWTIGKDMNSLNILVIHLIGAERYWIGDVIAGDVSGRDRESEFATRGLTEAELVQKLGDIEKYVQKRLEDLPLQALEEKRISPRNGREVSVGWAVCHAMKHTALHVGHIQVTRQLWEQHREKTGAQ